MVVVVVGVVVGVDVGVSVGCLVGWLVGWLAGWLVCWLVGWFVGWLCMFEWFFVSCVRVGSYFGFAFVRFAADLCVGLSKSARCAGAAKGPTFGSALVVDGCYLCSFNECRAPA